MCFEIANLEFVLTLKSWGWFLNFYASADCDQFSCYLIYFMNSAIFVKDKIEIYILVFCIG